MAKTITILLLEILPIEEGNFHVFLKIRVGRRNARLLVDTGASKTVFDHEQVLKFIDAEDLQSLDIQSVGLGTSHVKTQLTQLKSVRFNDIRIPLLEVAVLNLAHVNSTYEMLQLPHIDGVLGGDILNRYKAVIDYGKQTLKLTQTWE